MVKISETYHIKSPTLGSPVALASGGFDYVIRLYVDSYSVSLPNLRLLSISMVIIAMFFGHQCPLLFVETYISVSNIVKSSMALITPELLHTAYA